MKKIHFTNLIIFIFSLNTYAQIDSIIGALDYNQIKIYTSSKGHLFNDTYNDAPGYYYPKSNQTSLIYDMELFFGGYDNDDSLRLSVGLYNNSDYQDGPIAADYQDATYINKYKNKSWKVSQMEINQHIMQANNPGYIVPNNIQNWPGNGDTQNGESYQLAPYVDVNNNNEYDPENGDYPKIKGNEALYLIFNDDLDTSYSGGKNLGIEIHVMIYQFNYGNYLDSTTFMQVKVYNRSQISYSDFKLGMMVDADIGGYHDDMIACDPSNNLMIGYNGDTYDEPSSVNGYGNTPPALGIQFLNHSLNTFGLFNYGSGIYNYSDTSNWG